jgi:hypothetical protein
MKGNGVDMVKDATPFVAMSGGGALTLTPVLFLQIAGAIIGAAGVVLGYMRYRVADKQQAETKRANDLNQQKWEHELAKSQNSEKTEKQQSPGDGKSKKKTR